jgi:anti-sigma regulatory factor (Ser/Thr protein kinase)
MTGLRRPAGPADEEGDEAVEWPDTAAGHLRRPSEAASPRPATSAAGRRPSNGGSHGVGLDGRRREWRLHAAELSVTLLRRGLDVFLRTAPLSDDERDDLLLAACEAASNAIEHAQDPTEPFFDVLAEIGDARVTIVVCDHGRWRDAPSGIHRGRGLRMMGILADTTIAAGRHGTTVTIRSRPRPDPHAAAPDGEHAADHGLRTSPGTG